MDLKLLELRDRGTFIPVFAFRCRPTRGENVEQFHRERYLLSRAGYGPAGESDCVILGKLDCPSSTLSCTYDPFGWETSARTMEAAHSWITAHWDDLKSGDVVDVEFILGETKEPKKSEAED